MMRRSLFMFLLLFWAATTPAQESPSQESPPIQDNSFLIEEAYNQEAGVVQHVNTFMRQRGGDWLYTFTQEWPVGGLKHQFSFTLPAQRVGPSSDGGSGGVGDVALNYRYQLIGQKKLAVAPRFTVLLATGDERSDRGAGGPGIQFNLPVSVVHSPKIVTHWNAGATLTPSARNALGERARTTGYNLGGSLIWLARPNFNVLLESVWNSSESVVGSRRTQRESEVLLNPGIRWAHNFRRGNLQIVPGVAVPLGVGPSKGERGLFFYLSFEHSFKKWVE